MKQFDFTITDNTNYQPQDTAAFYSNALYGFPSAKVMSIMPNVKNVEKIDSYNLGSILQADSGVWSPTGEGTMANKTITVTPIAIQLDFPMSFVEKSFLANYSKAGSNNVLLPNFFESYLIELVGKQIQNDLELMVWQGLGSGSTYPVEFTKGLLAQLSADSGVVKLTANTITSANVIAELTRVYNAIPVPVYQSYTDVKICVSPIVARAFRYAQHVSGTYVNNWSDAGKMDFLGYEVVELPGLTGSQMVAASVENLKLATDLVDDFSKDTSIQVRNLYDSILVPTVRVGLRFKIGFAYAKGSEIVVYA